ncbi:MAG TPA: Ig-like domain-containing protein, partial [Bryobacteraceae bacterium]
AGKTYDVMINGQSTSGTTIAPYANALAVYDRELSLSGNAVERDAGMLAYIGINPAAGLPVASGSGVFAAAVANPDTYNALVAGQTLTVKDPSKGVIANDVNVYGVKVASTPCSGAPTATPTASCSPAGGTLALNANGTFTYVPNSGTTSDWFVYQANGNGPFATVNLGASNIVDSGVSCIGTSFTANLATYLAIKTPGVLIGCTDGAKLPLTVVPSSINSGTSGLTVLGDANGGFTAIAPSPGTYSFTFQAQNSHNVLSTATTVTLTFPVGSGLSVTVLDGQDKTTTISDYRWVIEEDRTFYIDPKCSTNPPPAGCPTAGSGIVPTLGTNFHTSYMPYVAQGCTGPVSCESGQTVLGAASVCDVGNGLCRPDTTGTGLTAVLPGAVALDPTKRYYISVLPGDAANPFMAGYAGGACAYGTAGAGGAACGHGMGGAPLAPGQTAVTVITQPSPYPPSKLSVFVFEDDFPLNGEQDGGGGIDVLSPNEPGLGGFQIHLWDAMGGNGDFTGQMTYDMFNQPLTNSLAGTKDPNNGNDACPIGASAFSSRTGTIPDPAHPGQTIPDPTQTGITGMIVTCPKYESDGTTLSPLAGQAVIANLMPGRWGAIATPGADRIARGEEWLQTNTLDGQKAHDVFTRIGEPSYFQEFGPASYHVSIGFANPQIINDRHKYVCNGTDPNINGLKCNNTLTGRVTGEHLSRTPDERLYSSGSHDTYYWSQCYVSFGDPDGEDFAFTKCNGDGTFTLTGLPDGDWRVTVFDQWNDLLVDGLSTPIRLSGGGSGATTNLGDIATTQWQTNLYTRTFIDDNKDGISTSDEAGIPFANVAVRLRDGSLENLSITDFTGTANFNETFPLFSWYTVETDVTRYKNTGTHVVYDVGGPTDASPSCGTPGYPPCGTSVIGKFLANTAEIVSVPTNLRVPGSVYCAGADCTGKSIQNGPSTSDPPSVCTTTSTPPAPPVTNCSTQLSSGRIDNPWTGGVEGWQGFPGQNNFLEFGKEPYIAGENGGIKGHVIYASTRPFDDPMMLVQTQWEPLVPHVGINLYQEGVASDGVTPTLTLVDHTQTTSFDDYAQGFHKDANGNTVPNMSCPGQGGSSGVIPDLFYFSLYNQPDYLDLYNQEHATPGVLNTSATGTPLPYNSQFKCYDGMHNWNQLQPAPYDGMYKFPSVTSIDPTSGKPNGTNCTICTPDPVPAPDLYAGVPMLPPGKYVVEVVVPPGFELVKEEDKNILIGDNFIAPVTQEFGGLGNIFIMPDQASVAASQQYPGPAYNANNAQNPTQSLGTVPSENIVPGFIPEPTWPCVGEARIVPDYISLYPQSKEVAPFAGATRNLCDRKEVTLGDQMGAIAKFYIFTSTHIASKFTGGITDDYTSEFDPFSPQFGEKFAPPDLPVSVKDWAGNEISRVYADHWGSYDGMTYSTWEVNPPNPTGYSPTMMVLCMNDPGPIPGPAGSMITDPAFTYGYSQFCYELPFMPGTTQYLDTPVVPTAGFAGAGYNNVDCAYPDATPAIAEVDGDGIGPWVSAGGPQRITITALGDQTVPNYAYSGPAATTAPYDLKTITRPYGFGAAPAGGCSNGNPNAACPNVTVGGIPLHGVNWSDSTITGTVQANVPPCTVQQQAQYQLPYQVSAAQCGQLVITAANGKQSIDAITVTIGGKPPTHVPASGTIQGAIDAAAPGDLIIVDPTCNAATGAVSCQQPSTGGATITGKTTAAHNELLLMWKPVRLQGVGAASSIINANTHPAGKLDVWRQKV